MRQKKTKLAELESTLNPFPASPADKLSREDRKLQFLLKTIEKMEQKEQRAKAAAVAATTSGPASPVGGMSEVTASEGTATTVSFLWRLVCGLLVVWTFADSCFFFAAAVRRAGRAATTAAGSGAGRACGHVCRTTDKACENVIRRCVVPFFHVCLFVCVPCGSMELLCVCRVF